MSKQKRAPLPYLLHTDRHGVRRARTRIPQGGGKYREVMLGLYGSAESRAKHRELCDEFESAQASGALPSGGMTVAALVGLFLKHAEEHYRDADGKATSELRSYVANVRPLLDAHGDTLARDFGPLALKAVRQAMVEARWARKTINQAVGRIRRIWRWGASEQLVPATAFHALQTVSGLMEGRTAAREMAAIPPAPAAAVRATFRELTPTLRAMVHLQLLTGMRPGEVCRLRACEIDRDGPKIGDRQVWVYRPKRHKTAWRGRVKAVVLGPRAQRIITPFLEKAATGPVFTPHRKGSTYSSSTYTRRIREACDRAGCARWAANQLRHSTATKVQHEYGLDATRAVLGHTDPKTSLIYAERDLLAAAQVAVKIG